MSFNTRLAHNRKKGFVLMETIASFAILTLAFASFTGTVMYSLRNFRNSQEKYVAAKIAQEGIEFAINKANNHIICISSIGCPILTWQENLIGDFEVDAAAYQKLLPSQSFDNYVPNHYICIVESGNDEGKFSYCGGSGYLPSRYTREVVIASINNYNIRITSTVHWGTNKSLILESIIFSGQP